MLSQLRMEGETLEIVGELVGSLGVKFANCDRAMDLLDKLASRTDINILALKKNPEVVEVIRKVSLSTLMFNTVLSILLP